MRQLVVTVRIVGALVIVWAIITQLAENYRYWQHLGITDTSSLPVNFFSFFTIESNVAAAFVFLVGAAFLARRAPDPKWFGIVRACTTAFMTVTFIVYNALLRGVNISDGLVVPWTNEVFHVVAPLLIVLDWLFAPGRIPLEWVHVWWIVAFPVAWAAYTMIRGPFVYNELGHTASWYPYPFLDPSNSPEAYASVAFYIAIIAVIIGLAGAAVIWVSRRPAKNRLV